MKFETPAIAVVLLALMTFGTVAWSQEEAPMMAKSQSGVALNTAVDWAMCTPDGVGVGGYDLVSYRQADGPVAGSKNHATEYDGVTYLFDNQSNLDQFEENPLRFLPAYSGFCAITLALGRVTCPEYTNFKVENGQLLLFEVTGFTNGRTLWNTDSKTFRRRADENFDHLAELK